jgi:hypothetical protein
MALDQSALLEVLEALKAADVDDRIRTAATTIYQALIEAELTAVIGAGPHERTDARTTQRNGSRPRTLSTTAGDLELRMSKLRAGSFRFSPNPMPSTCAVSSTSSPACWAASSRRSKTCCATPPRTCWRSPVSRSRTGRRVGQPTRWCG